MDIEKAIRKLNLSLPQPTQPGGNYSSVNIRGNVAFVAIQFPIRNGVYSHQGKLGLDLTTDQGYEGMQLCALNLLTQINKHLLWNQVEGINHIEAYYQGVEGWDEAPLVVNGASDLLINVLGNKGEHSRSIVGVHTLPRGFSVGLTATLTITRTNVWISS